ncbi:hypothetical protein P4627_00160, partial [Halalkalibacterium halodurans]|uniref:hypothetical protein n=1 Tax=Halalkalibacterium halodurans TaxID=86665 RepID=UPI002E22F05E|nr:hypothetical protein [Halalkalibacterium halodurans]
MLFFAAFSWCGHRLSFDDSAPSDQRSSAPFLLQMTLKKHNPIGLCFIAWQRPTLAGGSPQLPSALKSLTTVFG